MNLQNDYLLLIGEISLPISANRLTSMNSDHFYKSRAARQFERDAILQLCQPLYINRDAINRVRDGNTGLKFSIRAYLPSGTAEKMDAFEICDASNFLKLAEDTVIIKVLGMDDSRVVDCHPSKRKLPAYRTAAYAEIIVEEEPDVLFHKKKSVPLFADREALLA